MRAPNRFVIIGQKRPTPEIPGLYPTTNSFFSFFFENNS